MNAIIRANIVRRASDRCEVRAEGCTGTIDGFHHRFKPGRTDSEANLVAVCDNCHTLSPAAIHRNIEASVAVGLLRRSWEGMPDEPWQRPEGAHR